LHSAATAQPVRTWQFAQLISFNEPPVGGSSKKFPTRSWAPSNASTLRRNSSSPRHALSKNEARCRRGTLIASENTVNSLLSSSFIESRSSGFTNALLRNSENSGRKGQDLR